MKKYTRIENVQAQPMTSHEANDNGYKTNICDNVEGYEVEDSNGRKYWVEKDEFERDYNVAETFLDRIVIETNELGEKIQKLTSFIEKNEAFKTLSEREQKLLSRQKEEMEKYYNTLKEREILIKFNDVENKHKGNEEYVEIGGLKWRRCNVGANKETDKGLYFSWGGTVGYHDGRDCVFHELDYKSNTLYNKTKEELIQEHILNEDGILTTEYDAVAQNIGDGWRLPTKDDFKKLFENTYFEWVENFHGTGVKGRKFVLKDFSDYIFFPAAGFVFDGIIRYKDDGLAYLWCGDVGETYDTLAQYFFFDSHRATSNGVIYTFFGHNVRGVHD